MRYTSYEIDRMAIEFDQIRASGQRSKDVARFYVAMADRLNCGTPNVKVAIDARIAEAKLRAARTAQKQEEGIRNANRTYGAYGENRAYFSDDFFRSTFGL